MLRSLARALAKTPSTPCRAYSTLAHPRLSSCAISLKIAFGPCCTQLVRHRPNFAPLAVNVLQVRFSGHNKWSKIRHTKGAKDAKKSQIFAKLCLEIISAIKGSFYFSFSTFILLLLKTFISPPLPLAGGTDITTNLRLAAALNRARLAKMPKENIEGAFSKATKSKDAAEMEDQTYEGYGPGGVAMIIETITDKKNRTSKSVREILNKHGGSFSSVLWMFEKKGKLRFHPLQTSPRTPDQMVEDAIEAGAEDVEELIDDDAEGVAS
ncbi:transcriptional regulator-domain-containing protein, partial [Endogone sp. FLAS-F59071]